MSQQVALAARLRSSSGKGEARRLRREGRVPAIAYGADLSPTSVSVDARELYHALHTEAGVNAIIRLSVDGDEHLTLAREVQRDPLKRDVLHVDFVAINRRQKVTVDVPVRVEGEAPGATEGGVLDQVLFTAQVEVLPLEVPAELVIDVSDMDIGDVKRAADIVLPEGVELLEDSERTVATLTVPQRELPEEEEVEEVAVDEAQAEGSTADEAEAVAEGNPAAIG